MREPKADASYSEWCAYYRWRRKLSRKAMTSQEKQTKVERDTIQPIIMLCRDAEKTDTTLRQAREDHTFAKEEEQLGNRLRDKEAEVMRKRQIRQLTHDLRYKKRAAQEAMDEHLRASTAGASDEDYKILQRIAAVGMGMAVAHLAGPGDE